MSAKVAKFKGPGGAVARAALLAVSVARGRRGAGVARASLSAVKVMRRTHGAVMAGVVGVVAATTAILTEIGDTLTTEAGDDLATET